jgi:tRNA pseudouridine55 synthase
LDPLASGVLPVALGEATKTVAYAMNGTKQYRFVIRFGEARTTDDAEGEIIATSRRRPETKEIEAILPQFEGVIDQVPPAFSAVKVAGRRAYARARAGQTVELASRPVRIDHLELVARLDADTASFELTCGKGVYVRSLARDLARALGSVGYVAELRRTRVGPFDDGAAIPLDKLDALGHSARDFGHLLPVETALDDIPALALTGDEAAAMRQGRPVKVPRTGGHGPRAGQTGEGCDPAALSDGTVVCAMDGTRPVALARYNSGEVRPVRVLNL